LKKIFLAFCLAFAAATAFAEEKAPGDPAATADSPAVTSVPSFDQFGLAGRFGLGVSGYPQNNYGSRPNATPGPLLSLRYWFTSRWAAEISLGFAESFADSGYYDPSNNEKMNQYYAGLEGLACKYNIGKPSKYVLIQGILSVLARQDESLVFVGTGGGNSAAAWSNPNYVYTGYVGLGFEVFLPFWQCLSLEGSVGINPGGTMRWNALAQNYYWIWAVETNDAGLIPLNASAHYYF
jgi:hypothetical protein